MANPSAVQCVCLTGPTACGKTDLALEIARRVPLEIVSMDSAMVYRGLDIGTAKPSPGIRATVPHHLIDILDPSEAYSAGRFARDATEAIRAIAARGRLPLLVGGTLLYLRALRDGLAALPRADDTVRRQLDAEAAAISWAAMHERLRRVDPEAAARIAPTDRQRIQRALEVYLLTGEPLSRLQRAAATAPEVNVRTIALVPEQRADLAVRIERRFDAMVAAGFVSEVELLRARGDLTLDMPSMRAVGYRQIWGYLDGSYDWLEARRRAIVATRQYAKRQLTWLRGDPRCEAWPAFAPDLVERCVNQLTLGDGRATKNRERLC
ncbi:MAG TPA: tRNA (adenosine(37)-N6)-dimethylallyltransferase MiaA [Gammaproteobacteria bacterium]|nr:tRNA (adenosine(37)-N6)-dimethylallyltransferase MiaA [Gammaproteobacteria bacterium]